MTKAPIRDVAASVRQRLLNIAHQGKEDFGLILTRYCIERLLYRLSRSAHRDRFILKGATLFTVWTNTVHRPTRDLDLLGFGEYSISHLMQVFSDICALDVGDDGLTFDTGAIHAAAIREDTVYGGIRVEFEARLGAAKIAMQVDVGFGDAITPEPMGVSLPVILDFPAPFVRAYQKETVVAEKFHAMVVLGMANSRMKDFFDLAWLADHFAFDEATLGQAIAATFARRTTPFPRMPPLALSREFSEDPTKQAQWRAFVRRINQRTEVGLADTVDRIAEFLLPFAGGKPQRHRTWSPGGPWSAI